MPAWMVRQLWKYPDQGIIQLKTYAHPIHKEKIDEEMIVALNNLKEEDAIWYLQQIKTPMWINTTGHREMDVTMIMNTLDTEEEYKLEALNNSGCMTSSVSKQFVETNKINTFKLPQAIRATNADRTKNAGMTQNHHKSS